MLKVTDWTVLDHISDTPTNTLRCHQHTWSVTQLDGKGTATRVQTYTPETRTATPTGTRGPFQTLHQPHQPPTGTLAGTQNGYALDSGCPGHQHDTPHHVAPTGPLRGGLRAQAWDDKDTTLGIMGLGHGTDSHAQHRQPANPSQHDAGHAPAQGSPKPAPQPTPEAVRPKPQPEPEGAGALARRAKQPRPARKVALPTPKPKRKPHTCPYFSSDEGKAMHPEYPDGAEVHGVCVCSLKG